MAARSRSSASPAGPGDRVAVRGRLPRARRRRSVAARRCQPGRRRPRPATATPIDSRRYGPVPVELLGRAGPGSATARGGASAAAPAAVTAEHDGRATRAVPQAEPTVSAELAGSRHHPSIDRPDRAASLRRSSRLTLMHHRLAAVRRRGSPSAATVDGSPRIAPSAPRSAAAAAEASPPPAASPRRRASRRPVGSGRRTRLRRDAARWLDPDRPRRGDLRGHDGSRRQPDSAFAEQYAPRSSAMAAKGLVLFAFGPDTTRARRSNVLARRAWA